MQPSCIGLAAWIAMADIAEGFVAKQSGQGSWTLVSGILNWHLVCSRDRFLVEHKEDRVAEVFLQQRAEFTGNAMGPRGRQQRDSEGQSGAQAELYFSIK